MKEMFGEPEATSVEVPTEAEAEAIVARSEAAAALADVGYGLDVPRDSGEPILAHARRSARPVLLGAVASITILCLWRLSRTHRSPRVWHPRQQPSLLSSTLRSLALSVARVALARVVDRVVRGAVSDLAQRPVTPLSDTSALPGRTRRRHPGAGSV